VIGTVTNTVFRKGTCAGRVIVAAETPGSAFTISHTKF